jgi:CheY-like chemotaxis protein
MNGFEATQAIHTHRRGREIPVMAVSSYCVDYGYRSGAFKDFIAYVGKPWEEEALLQIVMKVLSLGGTATSTRAA